MKKRSTCPVCDGHGVVADYGPFGMDFYGPKECGECRGSGVIRSETDKAKPYSEIITSLQS